MQLITVWIGTKNKWYFSHLRASDDRGKIIWFSMRINFRNFFRLAEHPFVLCFVKPFYSIVINYFYKNDSLEASGFQFVLDFETAGQ